MHFFICIYACKYGEQTQQEICCLTETSVGTSQQNVAPTSKPYSAGVIIIVHVATDQVAWTASDRS